MNPRFATVLLLLGGLFAATQAQAQATAANYSFSTTTSGSLADMSSDTTTLLAANVDDTASPVTLLGFDFFFMGVRQDRFSVNDNGVLRLGAAAQTGSPYKPLGQSGVPILTAFGADQRTHLGDGRVHLRVTGAPPSRVATIEWLNNQANFNSGGTADLTYQVRLFEGSGCIEYVYGSMTMSTAGAADANSRDPHIGFSSGNAVGVVGTVTAPQSGTPAPTFSGASAAVANLYTAGAIPALSSAAQGSRRTFQFCPPVPTAAGGPLAFTDVSQTAMTLNWTDSPDELSYAIYRSTDGVNFDFVVTAPQNATAFAASGLAPSVSYTWRVVAVSEGALATPLVGTQATPAPAARTSIGTGAWSDPATWTPAGIPGSGDAVTIASGHTVTIDVAALAYSTSIESGATLQYEQFIARTLTVGSDVTVQAGATLQSNPAGTITAHNLSLAGNLVNDGTLDFSTNADTAGATITFTSPANTSFSGSGAITDIRQIAVNKGTSPAAVLHLNPDNFTVRGVTTDTVTGGWLVMNNGTIRIGGTFSGTSRVFGTAAYTIPSTFGFWLDNPNYTVAAQNGSPTLGGSLRVSQGTFNIGTATGNSMGFSTGSSVVIEGGAVNASGRFGVAAPTNTINYSQSAGTITVCTAGNTSTTLGSFDLGTNTNSNIAFSGGTVVVQLNATTIDYRNQAGSGFVGVTGGSLQLGNAASGAAKTFNLRGVLPNVLVTSTSAGHTAAMSTTLVSYNNIARNLTIEPGATFNTGNVVFLMAGTSLVNNGTLTASGASSNFVWFDVGAGAQSYSGTGVTATPITSMAFQNTVSFSSTNQVIANRVNMFSGGALNSERITIGNGGSTTAIVQLGVAGPTAEVTGFDEPPTFNPGTGGVNLLYAPELGPRTTGNEVPPTRTLNLLSVTNPNDITIAGGDIEVNGVAAGAINLGGGRVITGANALYLNSASGTVTRTTGYVDGNFRKSFAAAGSKTFEVGSASGYAPITLNATNGTFPTDIEVASVETVAPGIPAAGASINRHWRVDATDVTANIAFRYLDVDIPGGVAESDLRLLRLGGGPGDYNDDGGTIDDASNIASVTGATQFSIWTLGLAQADLSISTTDGVDTVSPGETLTYTTTATNAGALSNPAATVTDVFPAELTCTTTCVGSGGGACSAGPFAGDINDSVSLPAGASVTYTSVCVVGASASGTITNTATIAAGAIPDPDGENNSATDIDTVTQGNLTIAPEEFDFGGVRIGETSALGTLTLANDGSAAVRIDALTLAAAPFVRTSDGSCGNSLPITIAAGASCTLTYEFEPTEVGPAQQSFTLGTDATGDSAFTLSGLGVPAQDEVFSDGFEE